ncbi:STAS domain-containing protein [Gaiella sp.]|uniref:STAS domain-containing protein n=1 Tax=Gaiella sp. TaxID=2663207 RepID=UPI003982F648
MHSGENTCVVSDGGVVELIGEHDITSAPEMSKVLDRAARMSPGSLRVDLTRTTFIDSSIVAAIVGSARELTGKGRGVALRVLEGSTAAAVFAIVGLGNQPGVAVELVPAPEGPDRPTDGGDQV